MKHFAILDGAGFVSSVHPSAMDDMPIVGEGLAPHEIPAALAQQIALAGLLYDNLVPRWALVGDEVCEVPDSRRVLEVRCAKVVVAGQNVRIDMTYSEPIEHLPIAVLHNGVPRRVIVRFDTGGGPSTTAFVDRVLAEGRYSIASAEPSLYRVTGDLEFEVAESWS